MLQNVKKRAEETARPVAKTFHLNAILSLITGIPLSREGAAGPQRLAAFMMDDEADHGVAIENADTVRDCLEEQLPFLKDIDFDGLHEILKLDASGSNPYVTVWRERQALNFGEEHALVPLAAWEFSKAQKGL
ncbi:MAG TPA: hypothetical protein VEF76_10080 [Patescibacteria group bacterium]|nr:hypothetical protein [Patescibacteria group bacterium]